MQSKPLPKTLAESRLGRYLTQKHTAGVWRWNYRLKAAFRGMVDHPILIVGCGHSGTSILRRLLARRPSVFSFDRETGVFNHRVARHTRDRLRQLDLATSRAGRSRWLEKTPSHIRHIGRIFEHRPRAQIIWIVRDGRDVALSLKQRGFTLEHSIARWLADNHAGAEWQHDPRVIALRYETLVAQPENTIVDLLRRLDLDDGSYPSIAPPAIEPPIEKASGPSGTAAPERRDHGEFRRWQVAQPLFDGRGRWRSGLNRDETQFIYQRAGEALIRYGYTD